MRVPMTDEQIIMKHDQGVRPRARMELAIVNQFLADAERAGYRLKIQELEGDKGESYASIRDALFDLDDAHVLIDDANGKPQGWVYFVFGNDGYDCISDYTTNLEGFLAPCSQLSYQLENGLDAMPKAVRS